MAATTSTCRRQLGAFLRRAQRPTERTGSCVPFATLAADAATAAPASLRTVAPWRGLAPIANTLVTELPGDPDTSPTIREVIDGVYSVVFPSVSQPRPGPASTAGAGAAAANEDDATQAPPCGPPHLVAYDDVPHLVAYDDVPHLVAYDDVLHLVAYDDVPHLVAYDDVPHLVAYDDVLATTLGFPSHQDLSQDQLDLLVGRAVLDGSVPFAASYGGHQFGSWAGQLGDGRAISILELDTPNHGKQELQLKGAGATPYSRFADGRAVLRSSVREFLASVAMEALDIPTTKALSLVTSGESVVRDQFYNGQPKREPGAVVCRVAPSFLRFGSLELQVSHQRLDQLKGLVDYLIAHHFPHLHHIVPDADRYRLWFKEVVARSVRLVAQWLGIGFTHGVLNTDNMSLLGLTIDYGPYGFMERCNPGFTPNTSDAQSRYAYSQQPAVVKWNCVRLGSVLTDLVPIEELQAVMDEYDDAYHRESGFVLQQKLGLQDWNEEDFELVNELLMLMQRSDCDFTNAWRALGYVRCESADSAPSVPEELDAVFAHGSVDDALRAEWQRWLVAYQSRVRDGYDVLTRVGRSEEACDDARKMHNAILEAEAGDFTEVRRLHRLYSQPYDDRVDLTAPAYVASASALPVPSSDMLGGLHPADEAVLESRVAAAALVGNTAGSQAGKQGAVRSRADVDEYYTTPASPQVLQQRGVTRVSCSS